MAAVAVIVSSLAGWQLVVAKGQAPGIAGRPWAVAHADRHRRERTRQGSVFPRQVSLALTSQNRRSSTHSGEQIRVTRCKSLLKYTILIPEVSFKPTGNRTRSGCPFLNSYTYHISQDCRYGV
ncbi:hypothetical protein GGR52DRAFT_250726 [Hypoxylon sp. FL1284]|nr:hypothetical protein GGR52DRAFT_250726 [Hypoxylon sp. FL1284]